jgi:hypothetical protein
MDFNDPCLPHEATVRQFIQIIGEHAIRAIDGSGTTGVLQLFRINPVDEKVAVPSRFQLDDVDQMVQTALSDATAGHNVYIEARTVRKDLRGNKRGERYGLGPGPGGRFRHRQGQGGQCHRQAEPRGRDLTWKLSPLVPARPRHPGGTSPRDRRGHSQERRRRPGYRRRHPMLPRGWHSQLPVSQQTQTRANGGRADSDR